MSAEVVISELLAERFVEMYGNIYYRITDKAYATYPEDYV